MVTYSIRTDALSCTVEASNADSAARRFADDEGLRGVTDLDSLLGAYRAMDDGAFIAIDENGILLADSRR